MGSEIGHVGQAPDVIHPTPVHAFADIVVRTLTEHRDELNTLNVFPIADSDTGTNLLVTAQSARTALHDEGKGLVDAAACAAVYGRGALLGAAGNSGTILAAMLGSGVRSWVASDGGPEGVCVALAEAVQASYAAVGDPQEGTMLTVLKAASSSARAALGRGQVTVGELLAVAAASAREAVTRTQEQLGALRDAGVVDAGGRGISHILNALEATLTGRTTEIPVATEPTVDLTRAGAEGGPQFEVMYLFEGSAAAADQLKRELVDLGDSVVVIGESGVWNVHAHVDDANAAVVAGESLGRAYDFRITEFDGSHGNQH